MDKYGVHFTIKLHPPGISPLTCSKSHFRSITKRAGKEEGMEGGGERDLWTTRFENEARHVVLSSSFGQVKYNVSIFVNILYDKKMF